MADTVDEAAPFLRGKLTELRGEAAKCRTRLADCEALCEEHRKTLRSLEHAITALEETLA